MIKKNPFTNEVNILITGSSGYIGSRLIEKIYKNKNIKIYALTKNRLNKKYKNIIYINKSFEKLYLEKKVLKKIDFIFHLAFNNSIKDVSKNYKTNKKIFVNGLENLILSRYKYNLKFKLIFTSTCSIYGNKRKLPVNETSKDNPCSKYDMLKLNCEKIIQKNKKICPSIILRLTNIYGDGDSNLIDRNILFKVIRNAITEKRILIYGSGKFVRDYLYIDDLVQALIKSIEQFDKLSNFKHLNLGSGKGYYIKDIFNLISEEMKIKYGIEAKIYHKKMFLTKTEKRNFIADVNKFKKITSWSPKVNLLKGLKRLIKLVYYEVS